MRLTRVNERRNNNGGSPILIIGIVAVLIVIILVLAYWFLIRTTEETSPPTTIVSKSEQVTAPTKIPVAKPTIAPPPTVAPTVAPPTAVPTSVPTLAPTQVPAPIPTAVPAPTPVPTPALPLPAIVNDNPPHVFVGTVTIDGQPAPEGTEVTAWVLKYSEPVGTSVVPSVAGKPGSYSLLVPQHGNEFAGTVLMIKVNGNFIQNVIWKSGGGDPLDLAQ